MDDCSGAVIDAALKVHSALGPGLLEGAYEACLTYELRSRGVQVQTQVPIALRYGGLEIDLAAYRADLLVERSLLVELKSVPKLLAVHEAQLLSYIRMGNFRLGLLINFGAPRLKDGIRRKIINI